MSAQILQSWKDTRVAVMGLARSGVAACLFLQARGARVVGTDLRGAVELGSAASDLESKGISLSLGAYPPFASFDVIVLSPGVDPHQDVIAAASARGVMIVPELELGASEAKGRIVCVTGTKGKSTTTMSLHAMLRAAGRDVRAVGNIGDPITAHVDGSTEETIFVTEASSFQLETTQSFHPQYAVFLNLFPDHLDRHPSFESYAAAKARIFANQTSEDTAIVNDEDQRVLSLARQHRAKVIPFCPKVRPESTVEGPIAYFEKGAAIVREGATTILFEDEDLRLPGSAVRANLLAAATAADALGTPKEAIREAVRGFNGVRHTFERLGEVKGVAFFNDSKATTLESVAAALGSFETPVIAIMGGRLKAGAFTSLRDIVAKHVRAVYAIGESRGLVTAALGDICPVHETESLEEAVRAAYAMARSGDTILLSPGCSSFDMFRDYAHRGDTFRQVFHELALKGAA